MDVVVVANNKLREIQARPNTMANERPSKSLTRGIRGGVHLFRIILGALFRFYWRRERQEDQQHQPAATTVTRRRHAIERTRDEGDCLQSPSLVKQQT